MGLYMGVPAVLGAEGIEQIIELELTDSELEALRQSAAIIRQNVNRLDSPEL